MINAISDIHEAARLAAAFGVPLFRPKLYVPEYNDGSIGRWKLTRSGLSLDRGYYTGLWAVWGMPVLLRDVDGDGRNWETWMSLSPHEIESQELACRYASGHTVVMGLGMGWVAINIALNRAVRRVTVVERDPEVVELFLKSGASDGLPEDIADKLHIVEADALEWMPDEAVDFLFADIWRSLEEPQTLDEVRRMQANVRAQYVYFWGQELAIRALADKTPEESGGCGEWRESALRCVSERIGLPLLFPEDMDYPGMIADVARLRRERSTKRNGTVTPPDVALRPITDRDLDFLRRLYASTREEEKALVGWDDGAWDAFIRMQFDLQHSQYMNNYPNPSFDVITLGDTPVGRLYVNRAPEEIRIIDICLLPEYRGHGIGVGLMRKIMREGDETGVPVTLHVERNNPALSLYERLGFQIARSSEVYCFMKRPPGRTKAYSGREEQTCGERRG